MASSQNNPYNTTRWGGWFSDSLGGLVNNTKELSTKLTEKTSGLGSKLDSLLEDSDFSLDKMRSKIESTVDEVVDYFDDEAEQKKQQQQQQQKKASSRDVSSSDRDEASKKNAGGVGTDNTLFPNRALIDSSSDSEEEQKLKRRAARYQLSDDDEEDDDEEGDETEDELATAPVWAAVLGIAQDGGVPQPGCRKRCCINRKRKTAHVSCIALVEQFTNKRWLFDCTPDFPEQLRELDKMTRKKKPAVEIGSGVGLKGDFTIDSLTIDAANSGDGSGPNLKGIFLTHGHYGHYAGLLNFGKEVMNSRDVKVYCMPQLLDFLTCNAPWEQLVRNKNIVLECLEDSIPVQIGDGLFVTPFLVPHRADYTETVGFKIKGPSGYSALYLPDIDSWTKWEARLESLIKEVQIAFIDGTFYSTDELEGIRDISQVPHPPITQSIALLRGLPDVERSKVHFIHFNHTNPVLKSNTPEHLNVLKEGFCISTELMRFPL